MKIYISSILIVILSLFSSVLIGCNPHQSEQEKLAQKFGVEIEDFPDERYFPEGYFYTILKPGITSKEVHDFIQGYEKVLHCGGYREIYYYFSSDDAQSLRFEIIYDEQGKYKDIRSEDDDSRTIRTEGCELGLITDK